MTGNGTGDWAMVDEGWGREAVDFATLSEPANCREYVAMQHLLGLDSGDRLLDVACGAGLRLSLPGCGAHSAPALMRPPGWWP